MRNSKVIFDIQAREGVMVRSSMHRSDPSEITVHTGTYPATTPVQCAVMSMTSYCLSMLREAAERDPSIKGRYTFIVPETVAYRFYQAQGCVNTGKDIRSSLLQKWMYDDQYNMTTTINGETKTFNVWELTIANLAAELQVMMDKSTGWSMNFVNSRTLYRYEISSSDPTKDITEILSAGDTVNFVNGFDNEKGLYCREYSFLSGQYTVTRRDVRSRDQRVTSHFYVPRLIRVTNEKGEQFMSTADQIIAQDNLEPVSQTGIHVVNAAYLRTITAEKLPRIKSIKDANINVVAEGDIRF